MNYQLARNHMVNQQVRPWHVLNETVLNVMSGIPRELFVPPEYIELAYSDSDIPIGSQQTMLPPKTVGRVLQALQINTNEKVLEIGTGTGYITACLAQLARDIVSVEIDANLLESANKTLNQLDCRGVLLECGNAVMGWENESPFDAILVTGSYPLGVPQSLCEQLAEKGGRLLAFCGQGSAMEAVLIIRHGNDYTTTSLFETSVPALIHAPIPAQFTF